MTDWSAEKVVRVDKAHVWHPYAPHHETTTNIPIRRTEGQYLQLFNGQRIIDGMSSWWAASHGHSHPHLVDAASKQISSMRHVMFGGLTPQPAAELAQRLIFYVNNVSNSVTLQNNTNFNTLESVFL